MFLSSIILFTASIKFLGCQVIIGTDNINLTAVFQPNYNKCISASRRKHTGYYSFCANTTFSQLSEIPATTTRLDFIHNNITVLEGGPFSNYSLLNYLNLTENNIVTIKPSAFKGLHRVTDLILSDNLIETLEKDVFKYTPLISVIDFSGNRIKRLQSFAVALSSLRDLEEVIFRTNTYLDIIGSHELSALKNSPLMTLDLFYCNVREIGEAAFSHLKHLGYLILEMNALDEDQLARGFVNISKKIDKLQMTLLDITRVPTEALNHLSDTKIRHLYLSDNLIRKIESGDFPYLPSLMSLYLRNCAIEFLNGDVFKNLKNLRTLDLGANHLRTVEPAICNLLSLKILDLSGNGRYGFNLGEGRFANLTNLEVLSLNSMDIHTLKRGALHGLTNLGELFISDSLTIIDKYAFESLENLEKLIISGHNIEKISEFTFFGLDNLIELALVKHKIVLDPAKQYFNHTPNLKILDLSGNQIEHLPYLDLENLHKLETLGISGNKILPWGAPVLAKNKTNLKLINLRKNNLNYVTSSMQIDFDTIAEVDISENPYDCSNCETPDFALWINTTKIKLSEKIAILCYSPMNISQRVIDVTELPPHCLLEASSQNINLIIIINGVLVFCIIIIVILVYYFRWYLRYYWYVTRAKMYRLNAAARNDFRYDAFISYNAEDGPWLAENLLPTLENGEPRLQLCIPERDFPAGKEIVISTAEAMKDSHKVILLVSNNFLDSAWCIWEMKMAQFQLVDARREALVLIILEDLDMTKMTSTLKRLMRTRTYLQWPENVQERERFWKRLRLALQDHVRQRQEEIENRY